MNAWVFFTLTLLSELVLLPQCKKKMLGMLPLCIKISKEANQERTFLQFFSKHVYDRGGEISHILDAD